MTAPLPTGSSISVTTDGADTVIDVPYRNPGPMRYAICLFLLFWLGGWAFGWIAASSAVLSGTGGLFVLLWLGAWTVGGAWAAYMLYRMLRPSEPEHFRLMQQGLRYDSGSPPFEMKTGTQAYDWSSYFPKRTQADIERKQLQSLRLRPTPTSNRLTVDFGAARLDVARDATEIEREWLYRVLVERYRLAPQPETGNTTSGED